MISRLPLFPSTACVNGAGHLEVGGCDTVKLAAEFGTPLYVFDETNLRRQCTDYRVEFGSRYPDTTIIYATKAFTNRALLGLIREEGLGLDVVSGGELGFARLAGFPMGRIYFHGNNKSVEEIETALEWEVGHIVVDNFYELDLLDGVAGRCGVKPDILLRVAPGVDPHTHKYNTTGIADSKFGFPLTRAEEAVTTALPRKNVRLVGFHFHLGSLIFETEPFQLGINIMLGFAAEMKRKHNFEMKELDAGGGVAVQYTLDAPAPPISTYAEAMTSEVKAQCAELGLALPKLIVEPGRSIVARSAFALYTIGAIKDIPGIRRYVSVDGGMGDNVCPALYGERYEAVVANKMKEPAAGKVSVAGKFCESGDILIRDIALPAINSGDVLAVAGCGAYCIPQSSNYNAFYRPAVVLVKDGRVRLIRRRETLEDLARCDVA